MNKIKLLNQLFIQIFKSEILKSSVEPCFFIFAYHRVNDNKDPFFPSLPTKVFELQIKYIKQHFPVLTFNTLIEAIEKRSLPNRSVIITFDDGYNDNFSYAFPILKKYSVSATIFLTTGFISTNNYMWFDLVKYFFKVANKKKLQYDALKIDCKLDTFSQKLVSVFDILQKLKYLPIRDRDNHIEKIKTQLYNSNFENKPRLMLSWDEVRTMYKQGIDFGIHTENHYSLAHLSINEAKKEIICSIDKYEEELNVKSISFAYPFGKKNNYNYTIKDLLKKYGIKCACTSICGINKLNCDLFELKRGQPWRNSSLLFPLQLRLLKYNFE